MCGLLTTAVAAILWLCALLLALYVVYIGKAIYDSWE